MSMKFTAEQASLHNHLRRIMRNDRLQNGTTSTERTFLLLLDEGIGNRNSLETALRYSAYEGYLTYLLNDGYYKPVMRAWVKVKLGVKPKTEMEV